MKEKVLAYSVISLVLLYGWTLYLFFDYFTEKGIWFHGLGLFFNYVYSAMCAVGLGSLLLIIRLFFYLRGKINPLKSNFFYILCGIFNLNIFIIWLICIILRILEVRADILLSSVISSLLISTFIIQDIYRSNFKVKTD